MSYTITQLKTDLTGVMHGTSLSKVQGLDELIARAGRDVLADCDPHETRRKAQITNAVYDQVCNYAVPSDLKDDKVIDIRPQANRGLTENFSAGFSKDFDLYKTDKTFTIEEDSGIKFVRLSNALSGSKVLHTCDSLTANGTWAATSGAANLTVDNVYKISSSNSLKFDISTGTTGYIENSTMTAIDLTDHLNQAGLFLWIYIPDSTTFTSVSLRWGNDSSNYYTATATTGQFGAFVSGWNLVRFAWPTSATGTVTITAIDYLRVTVVTTTTVTGIRVDSIMSKLPYIYDMVYYSRYLFKTDAGVWQETVTDDSNIVNLETASYNLLLYKTAQLAAPQVQGADSVYDASFYEKEYLTKLKKYKASFPSQIIPKQRYYYRIQK